MIMSIFQKFINKKKLKNNCNKNQLKTENNYDNKNFEKKDSKNNYTELPSGKESKELQPLNFDVSFISLKSDILFKI